MKTFRKMQLAFADLWVFIRELLKRWFFWLFLLVDIVAAVAQYINPHFQLPQSIYIIFALFVFLFSAFAVYRDLLIAYRKATSPEPLSVSKLNLSFVEGNEYTYHIDDPYDSLSANYEIEKFKQDKEIKSRWENDFFWVGDVIYYRVPPAYVLLNLRLENTGDIPIDVIALNARRSGVYDNPISIYKDDSFISDKPLVFPIHLEKTVIIEINIKFKIITNPSNTNAQFFAEFRSIKKSFTVAINVDSLDNLGKKQQYNINNDIAWRPLVDLYINQLRKYSQKEYLRLAGYAFE